MDLKLCYRGLVEELSRRCLKRKWEVTDRLQHSSRSFDKTFKLSRTYRRLFLYTILIVVLLGGVSKIAKSNCKPRHLASV